MPPSVETIHWKVGAGLPEALTPNTTSWPAATLWLTGWTLKTDGPSTTIWNSVTLEYMAKSEPRVVFISTPPSKTAVTV